MADLTPTTISLGEDPAGKAKVRAGDRRRASRALVVLRRCLLGIVAVFLGYLTIRVMQALRTDDVANLVNTTVINLILAALIYVAGHGLRILRLALLIGGWRVGFRDIASFHLMTAAATLSTPLKLGELYRVFELSNLAGGLSRAIVITWWERVFDAAILLLILLLALANSSQGGHFEGVVILVAAFLTLTAVVFFVLPDNLRRISVLIIRRYSTARTIPLLHLFELVRGAILEAPKMVRGKVASLLALTTLIWAANVASFVIAIPALRGSWQAASGALLTFLSAVTTGQTLLGALNSREPALVVIGVTQAPLVVLGLVAALYYAWRRLRFSGLGLDRRRAKPQRRTDRPDGVSPYDRSS